MPLRQEIQRLSVIEFVLYLLVAVMFLMFGATLADWIGRQWGIDSLRILLEDITCATPENLLGIRWVLLVNQLFTFLIPALAFAFLYYKKEWSKTLFLNRFPSGRNLFWGVILLFFCFQCIQLLYWINQQIPLPDNLRKMEDSSKELIQAILQIDSPMSLWINLLIMALLPAIGEELVFRGILQRIATRLSQNAHLGIWITAFVFSAMHGQFEGFLPRFALGGMLGYLLYWSGSLWLPILVHFLFNGLQIIAQHLYFQGDIEINLDEVDMTPGLPAFFATSILLLACYFLHKTNQKERNHYEQEMGKSI